MNDALVRLMKPEMDAAVDKAVSKNTEEIVISMLKDGSLSNEKIAEFSHLPVEKVKELAEKNIA